MKATLAILVALAFIAMGTIWRALTAMCQDEIRARLGRLPATLIRFAALRLPEDARDDIAAEWAAELEFVLTNTETLPLTRLMKGMHFAAGLLWAAPAVTRELTGIPQNRLWTVATRAWGLTGMAYAVGEAISAVHQFHLHHFATSSAAASMALSILIAVLCACLLRRNTRRSARLYAVGNLIAAAGIATQGGWWISLSIYFALVGVAAFALSYWSEINYMQRVPAAPQ